MNKKLSIIIPAYNEEKNIGMLLQSIKRQEGVNFEVIVSDAQSTDNTSKIVKSFGYRVVKGGLPAKGRNCGAKLAKGDILLFLDADTILPNDFLRNALKEFSDRNLDIAGVNLIPISYKRLDHFLHDLYNLIQRASHKIDPLLSGACILIKKKVFIDVGCFDETLMVAEDHALARKAKKKKYNIGILKNFILLDVRRLDKEGRHVFISKLFYLWFQRLFGEIKKSKIKYDLKKR